MRSRFGLPTILLSLLLSATLSLGAAPPKDMGIDARIENGDIPGGICVVAGFPTAGQAMALAESDGFVIHALFRTEEEVKKAREAIQTAGLYGRVSADRWQSNRLPYTDNLINVLLINGQDEDRPSYEEAKRVLAPLGWVEYQEGQTIPDEDTLADLRSAGFKPVLPSGFRVQAQKPWPEEIDEWTHHLHGPDGNAVANDRLVGPPEHYQWIADPVWAQSHESDSNFRCLVTAKGRIYYIVNEAPTSMAGPESPPDKWFLTARDAFNGVFLWKVPVEEWGWREWKPSWFTPRPGVIPINLDKRVVADGDMLYATLGFRAPVSQFDGRTGDLLQTYEGTERAAEILVHDGRLVVTCLQGERAVVKLVETELGKLLWTSEKDYGGTITDYYRFTAMGGSVPEAKVDPTLDIATDGQVIGLLDGDSVVCLDYATGKQRWRTKFPLVEADYNAGRIKAFEKVWTGTMIVADGVLVHASPNQLAAFSAETGEILWKQPKKFLQHLWYEWKEVFLIDGLVWTWSAELAKEKLEGGGNSLFPVSANGYDLHTGELNRKIPLGKVFKTHHHHRCYRNKATVRYILASRRGTEFIDLTGGEHSVNNWVRGTCHMGMVPANGLQYAPPHPCQCYNDEKLKGMNALASARPSTGSPVEPRAQLVKGPSYASLPSVESAPGDWLTFRADAARSGSAGTELPTDLGLLWQSKLGEKVAPPISVGDKVFVPLVDEHQIVACSVNDGRVLWRYHAGARIDSPPTYDRGALLFGSADGCVYRVAANDGSLIWKLRAVPEDRRIAAFGQLESAWPVHGSILVAEDPSTGKTMAYFAAGRSSHLDGGIRLLAVDATTGQIVHEEKLTGPRYTDANIDQNFRLPEGTLPDIMRTEGTAIFMRTTKLDRQLQQQRGVSTLKINGGFLDDAYFKRMPWVMGTSGHARLIVNDDSHAYCLRMFDSLQGLDPKVYFTPGSKGYLLYAHDLGRKKNVWQQRVPIRGRAMVVTESQLCVAGPPDIVPSDDPLGAFEGRKGGVLRVVDKTTGETASEHRLPMPPVFNGAAAANGRLFLALEDGSVACYGR